MVKLPFKQTLTKEQAHQKIKHYCAYQERCHQEVKEKLYGYGLHTPDVDFLISGLIEENYLNEERFAILYAGGKFRMNDWGRIKIRYALRQKQVSDYCIKKALKEIDADDYQSKLQKLAESKWELLKKEKSVPLRKQKLQAYLMQKGYESDLIQDIVKTLEKGGT